MQPLGKAQNKFWLSFFLCALGAALLFLPFVIVDKGLFLYAGDFNSQQIPFYYYANEFIRSGGGSFSWATDLGSGFINSYSFYHLGSPFFWVSLLFPAAWMPFLMVPMLVLKFGVAGAGAYLWSRRYLKDPNMAVLTACLYAFSGFTVYNVFFNHFVDVIALFPYLLYTLDEAVINRRRGPFAIAVALNLLNNYFFFAGQVVFLPIYFVCMLLAGNYKPKGKTIASLAFESIVGCGMGAILAWPALLSLSNNPRTVDLSSGFGFLLYNKTQQYAAILYNLFFPPDSPYMPVIFTEGSIKWTSLSAYLPLVSMVGVIAYLRSKEKTAFKWILYICLAMACVPALNSAFYAMNSSYYARWFYMPVLVMAVVTASAFEDTGVDVKKGIKPTVIALIAFCAFALVPKEDDGVWSLGVIEYPQKFWANLSVALLGVVIFCMLWQQCGRTPVFARRITAAVLAFGCLYGVLHLSVSKFAQWENDGNYRQQQYHDMRALGRSLPAGAYRIDDYECYDNIGLWADKSCLQFFNSTVAPAIMEFYPQVDVKRDVRSEPNVSLYALRGLLGVAYTVLPEYNAEEFEEKAGEDWVFWGKEGQMAVYENKNTLPLAFGVDAYVTEEEYEGVNKTQRSNVLLRALVLSDEQLEDLGDRAPAHLSAFDCSENTRDRYNIDMDARRDMAAEVQTDRYGLTAVINLDEETPVLFTAAWDEGFSATLNGEEADILKVDGGLMAVIAPAGESVIRLDYTTPGLAQSLIAAAVSAAAWLGYSVYHTHSRRKKVQSI